MALVEPRGIRGFYIAYNIRSYSVNRLGNI